MLPFAIINGVGQHAVRYNILDNAAISRGEFDMLQARAAQTAVYLLQLLPAPCRRPRIESQR